MIELRKSPALSPGTFLLCALSLSIGWGIRGNFGHEYGAMLPGALTAIAVCLLSGRADWRDRVAYFGLFGALGWAFGGSMSYMQVVGYTHSGHAPSQYYGFFCLFLLGALWGGLGGAGTAFPAVVDRDRLTAIFRPMLWIFAAWTLHTLAVNRIEAWESSHAQTWSRHESPLYWLDADWLEAVTALLAICLFDLWDRRFRGFGWLLLLVAAGAALGCLAQQFLDLCRLTPLLAKLIVVPQGDVAAVIREATTQGVDPQAAVNALPINWPEFLRETPQHIGWAIGALFGAGYYFRRWGAFRAGASLFLYMILGWFACFILFPVLLGFGGAGFRMTPPRGDQWAGILGLYIATLIWLHRNRLVPVVYASLIAAIVGGLGFSGAVLLKLLMVAPGNPTIVSDPGVIAAWQHWQRANWHSVLEQSYGFINGIGIALAMGLLARRQGLVRPGYTPRPWTETAAIAGVLFGVTGLNLFKNIPTWVESYKTFPARMTAPLFDSITLSAETWLALIFFAAFALFLLIARRHRRDPLACIPESSVGQGQLLYLALLWIMVVGNFERAMPAFSEGRLITEWVITINALLATWLVLTLPRGQVRVPELGTFRYEEPLARVYRWGLVAVLVATLGMTWTVRAVYGDAGAGHSGKNLRFGEEANWRRAPIMKGASHK